MTLLNSKNLKRQTHQTMRVSLELYVTVGIICGLKDVYICAFVPVHMLVKTCAIECWYVSKMEVVNVVLSFLFPFLFHLSLSPSPFLPPPPPSLSFPPSLSVCLSVCLSLSLSPQVQRCKVGALQSVSHWFDSVESPVIEPDKTKANDK